MCLERHHHETCWSITSGLHGTCGSKQSPAGTCMVPFQTSEFDHYFQQLDVVSLILRHKLDGIT